MKNILNLLPIFTFFMCYKFYDIFTASKCLIVTSGLICIIHWLMYHRLDKASLFSFISVLIFGSLTIFFHNSQFIKWKITAIYAFFSIMLIISQFWMKKSIIQRLLDKKISLHNIEWNKINFFWALFFLLCSILNIYIAFWCSENAWVNFKVFGLSILMILAFIITSIYIHIKVSKQK